MASGSRFVLSLVLSLAHSPQLHKQYFVRTDDMHASKLFSAAGSFVCFHSYPVSSLKPFLLIPIIYYYLFTQQVLSLVWLPDAS